MRRDRPRIHRVDSNQAEIVSKLRQIPGLDVFIANADPFDLIVGLRGRNYLYEIKRNKSAKLEKLQEEFCQRWAGHWKRVESLEDILKDIGFLHEGLPAGLR
jgi:hypothetical protein